MSIRKFIFAGLFSVLPFAAAAQSLDDWFMDLKSPDRDTWRLAEDAIINRFNHSGSAAMDLLVQRGHTAIAAQDYATAIWHLSAAIDHAPDFAEAYNARATAYYMIGELGLSLADIEMTLAINPRHFGALSGLGLVLEELGHEAQALSAYRAALVIHPNWQATRENLERLERKLSVAL